MLTINLLDNSLLLEDRIENYFLLLTYCKKYNFNFTYNLNLGNLDNDLKINYTNIHYDLINLFFSNNNNIITLNINNYIKNILSTHITFNKIIYEINQFNEDYKLFKKFEYYNFDYICINIYYSDIINDTKNYLSINYFIDKYNELNQIYKSLKLVIISTENINKYFTNYILFNINNDIDKLNIMINAKYLISSNSKLDYYARLLNKNNFI